MAARTLPLVFRFIQAMARRMAAAVVGNDSIAVQTPVDVSTMA
jgi:hypothetical protein